MSETYTTVDPDAQISTSTYDNPSFQVSTVSLDHQPNDRNGTRRNLETRQSNIDSHNGDSESVIACKIKRLSNKVTKKFNDFRDTHSTALKVAFWLTVFILYNVYLGYAIRYDWHINFDWCQGSKFLLLVTILTYIAIFYRIIATRYILPSLITKVFIPLSHLSDMKIWSNRYVRISIYLLPLLCMVLFIVFDAHGNTLRIKSGVGIFVLILFGLIFSKSPTKVRWRPVIWGIILQFIFGLLILRWSVGKAVFRCLGEKVATFLEFTDSGTAFVFSYLVTGNLTSSSDPDDKPLPHQNSLFAFKVLPVIIFFSFFTSILYHLGIMQALVKKIGWLLNVTVGTTAAESLNAASNIFVGQTEAPLLIGPFIKDLTKSELHAVMTGGFATIAGTVLAAYINFGVDASHLLSASVMSAPAALAYSKLFYPETEQTKTMSDDIEMDTGDSENLLEAASKGASNAISLVANIAANLIAFLAFIAFLDGVVMWFGSLVGYPFFSFNWIMSKLFIPLAYIMGVEWEDCEEVAELIGYKTIANEFIAYAKLGVMIKEKTISARSQTIATYALCGFSNLSSIGIQLGGLGAIAPERKSHLAQIAFRAMIAGSAACFMTACIAGALITHPVAMDSSFNSTTPYPDNSTSSPNNFNLDWI